MCVLRWLSELNEIGKVSLIFRTLYQNTIEFKKPLFFQKYAKLPDLSFETDLSSQIVILTTFFRKNENADV